jgi:hypothetical protein
MKTMYDGRVANMPNGADIYAGYVDNSAIGITFPALVSRFAGSTSVQLLSISVHGASAMCADVESGALTTWAGYDIGYCSIARAQTLINQYGRPKKLWTAHYTDIPHLCDSSCGFGFIGQADATQWTDHNGVYDESLCLDDFLPPLDPQKGNTNMLITRDNVGRLQVVGAAVDNGNLMVFTETSPGQWSVTDVTNEIHLAYPNDPRAYKLQ